MPTIILTKDEDGRLCGITEADNRGYERFISRCVEMTSRDSITFTWKEPRSGPYHRRHFAMLNALFKAQETFLDADVMRKWAEMEAGFFDEVPSPSGPQRIPRSIAYDKLDQLEFEPLHQKVFEFYRGEFALSVLWPHLSWQKAYEMIDNTLREFE